MDGSPGLREFASRRSGREVNSDPHATGPFEGRFSTTESTENTEERGSTRGLLQHNRPAKAGPHLDQLT
jgi:hypothetical protein